MAFRALLLASALILGAAPLAGCGFTPLYAAPGVAPGMSAIQVVAPEGRIGVLLRESLDDALAHRPDAPAAYRLEIVYDATRTPLGLRVDDVARRYQVTLAVQYTLTDTATGQIARQGRATSFVSYDVADQPYAAIAARQDVQQRAADEVARRIHLDLAQWFVDRSRG